MLLFISCGLTDGKQLEIVSIHLMLLFIGFQKEISESEYSFNTSHVTLYRNPVSAWSVAAGVSIHLMLLFISKSDVKEVNLNRFQYISCYSLSLRPQENIPCQTRFNTSHVTLYPEVHPVSDPSSTFQ